MTCPDCGTEWNIEETPRCEGCDLAWQDVVDAAAFWDDLNPDDADQPTLAKWGDREGWPVR